MPSIDLGFTEPVAQKWKFKNKYFPSKVGGKPVFLDLKSIPEENQLKCLKCHQMLRFLLQIYAPIETKDNAFHRTLFVFCCLTNDCNSFKVLRSELSRINDFYSSEPPNYDLDDKSYDPKPEQFGHQLCFVCGIKASKKCSKCLEVSYCSKQHQIIDWKEGNHKQICGSTHLPNIEFTKNSVLFPELDLIMGDNQSSDGSETEEENNDSESERNEMKKYNELFGKTGPDCQTQDVDKYTENETEDQKAFNRFKRLSSDEVIRYCSYDSIDEEVEPLWISAQNKPNLPIPNCQYCNGKRRFEFQIMPHLLNKMITSEDSLDWGTLVVYTCLNSCSNHSDIGYKEEFIWNQIIT